MKYLFLVFLMFPMSAMATSYHHNSKSVSNSKAVSKSQSLAASASQSIALGSGGSSKATGGSVGDVSLTSKTARQAPDVTVIPGNNTAPFLKCFGWGGSNDTGGTAIGWCWLQRDEFARQRSVQLFREGHYEASARAYCSKKLLYKDYGGKEECLQARLQMRPNDGNDGDLGNLHEDVISVTECAEAVRRCEQEVFK